MKECTTHHYACDCREKAFAELLETVKWIASQQNLFFAECTQAEEIVNRCKRAVVLVEFLPSNKKTPSG